MHIRDIPRYDGGNWREFVFGNGTKAVLTSRGRELFAFNPELRNKLNVYRSEAEGNISGFMRTKFRPGGNSTVYRLGDTELLIKEGLRGNRPPLWLSLDRMDYLYGVCERFLDPYVKVPDHYALFTPAIGHVEYLLMRKINNGVTVEDVKKGRVAVAESTMESVAEDFLTLKKTIKDAIDRMQHTLKIPYPNLLPDWSESNVLVDFTLQPRDKPYTLWIIDQ